MGAIKLTHTKKILIFQKFFLKTIAKRYLPHSMMSLTSVNLQQFPNSHQQLDLVSLTSTFYIPIWFSDRDDSSLKDLNVVIFKSFI